VTRSRLGNDERGAIMVLALFFAIFALGMLYLLLGTASAVFLREKLQDTADAAALSGAVMHARGMNVLVLINIVMAALLAILVTLKLVESVAILGIILAAALAWLTGGATLSAVPPLKSLQQQMHETYDELKDPIYDALTTLHDVADAVKEAVPPAAIAVVEVDHVVPAAPIVGFVVPPRLDLPVEDGSFAELCGQAGRLPGQVASYALEEAGIPAVPKLTSELGDAVGALAEAFSGWFCEDPNGGSGQAPQMSRVVKRSYPRVSTRDSERCAEVDSEGGEGGDDVEEACERAHDEEEAGKPDGKTGNCRSGVDCSIDGPYETRLKLAREQCDPTVAPAPFTYWYQQRTGRVSYEWAGEFWKRHEPVMNDPVRMGGENGSWRAPCGPKSVSPQIVGYNEVVHPKDDLSQTLPVCSDDEPPPVPIVKPAKGTIETREITEITQILGCQKQEREEVPITAGEQAGAQSDDKSPKVVEQDVALGDKNFQLRALMMAEPNERHAEVVELSSWHREPPEQPLSVLRPLRGFAVAQAEYFYDGAEARDAWMWNMNWRGRLRRFRMLDSDLLDFGEACDALPDGDDCRDTLAALNNTLNLINH
jgi:hypothetical protein